tara:strand:+ start:5343 stop:6269 length:927 start_codon:yes stop_codon:yes gene_type:complete
VKIAVLLCTKNGARYIQEQLISIAEQNIGEIDLYISENKSSDDTSRIIEKFAKNNKNINIIFLNGMDLHFANNYVLLAKSIKKVYQFYAFCDQDDIWLKCHLERGISCLEKIEGKKALLHCSRTMLINENGKKIGKSQKFIKKPFFQNALVQSIAGANTMIFNKEAFNLLIKISSNTRIVSHDWLLYILVSGSGGEVIYNQIPTVLYRQHDKNIIGSNMGILNKIKRLVKVFEGEYRDYNLSNFDQIESVNALTIQNHKIYKYYKESINGNIFLRLFYLFRSGVYRQSIFGQLGLILSIFITKRRFIK